MTLLLRRRALARPATGFVPGAAPLNVDWYAAYWGDDPSWSAPAEGVKIASWRDLSGHGRHAVQADTTRQPKLVSGSDRINAKKTLGGWGADTVNGHLAIDWAAAIPQPFGLFLVYKWPSTFGGNGKGPVDGKDTSHRSALYISASEQWFGAGAAGVNSTASISSGVVYTVCMEADGANSKVRVNNIAEKVGSAGTNTSTGLTIGNLAERNLAGGYVIAFLGFKAGLFTAQEKADLRAWVNTFYGQALS